MSEKKRLFYVIFTLIATSLGIGLLGIYQQYTASLKEKLNILLFQLDTTKALIEAVARFDRRTFRDKRRASQATLSQIEDAFLQEGKWDFEHTILFARKLGKGAEIFMRYEDGTKNPIIIEPENHTLPLPIKYALEKKRGAGLYTGLSGKKVLAAYDYVDILDIALVIKVRLDIIQRPYIIKALLTFFLAGIILVFSAILVLKITEPILQKLEEKEKLSQLIVETVQDVLLILDKKAHLVMVNPAFEKIFGYQNKQILGRYVSIILPPEYPENRRFYQFLQKPKERQTFQAQMQGKSQNGKEIPFFVKAHLSKVQKKEYLVLSLYDLTQLIEAQKKIMELSQKILEVQEQERQVISREIHDVLASYLVGLKLATQAILGKLPKSKNLEKERKEILEQFNETIEIARKLSQVLSPYGINHLDLPKAIEKLVVSYQNLRSHIKFRYSCIKKTDFLVDDNFKLHVYRVVQEAIQNAIKHSGADKIEVYFKELPKFIVIGVKDNGCGFHPGSVQSQGLGILIMQERALLLKGKLFIKSKLNKGSEVRLVIPKKRQV